MTLTSGTRLGPYEILSPLGAGGMGEVYRRPLLIRRNLRANVRTERTDVVPLRQLEVIVGWEGLRPSGP